MRIDGMNEAIGSWYETATRTNEKFPLAISRYRERGLVARSYRLPALSCCSSVASRAKSPEAC
ncbi:MAG: hypothetical protein AB7O38_20430 [Pirellulaceae bacterium]